MKNFLTAFLLVSVPLVLLAQDDQVQAFEVHVSTDTILYGNYLEVRFTAHNISGKFESPKFEDFNVIGGPNQSTNMSIVNGVASQSASYSYFIEPKNTGLMIIEPAFFVNNKEENHETPPIEIICLPNPDGISKESRIEKGNHRLSLNTFPFLRESPERSKKKLKVTKI